jgi:hypothetical protein
VDADKFYEIVTLKTLHGHHYNAGERKEIDDLMRQRARLLPRLAKVERDLATIEKEGVIIKKHCPATPDEIQTAVRAYKQELRDAEALVLAMELGLQQLKEAKARFRRMSG